MAVSSKIFFISVALLLFLGLSVSAQESLEAVIDENVTAEDLQVQNPRILPDNFLYPIKNTWRKVQEFFTFDPVAKIELKEKFSSEKLIELKQLVEKGASTEAVEKALENYKKESEGVREKVVKLEEKAKDNPRLDSFLDKFLQQEILHQRILLKLKKQVPEETFEKINQERERHLERFGEVMLKLEEKEQIRERLEKNLQNIKGSEFKEIKNLELLKELKEKLPEQTEEIRALEEKTLEKFRVKLETMSEEKQEDFRNYLESVSAKGENYLEVIEELKNRTSKENIRQGLEQAQKRVLEAIEINQ